MDFFFKEPSNTINVLIVYDVDSHSASLLAERFVPQQPKFDMIVVIGPFSRNILATKEELATAEGDIASTLAQLENIVCRVVYLSGENDPPSTMSEQLHLTPNSVNIYSRRLPLREGLCISGFTETGENLQERQLPDDVDRSPESDDELDGVSMKSGVSTINIIKEILCNAEDGGEIATSSNTDTGVGIFALNYKFIHTLNYFLFHMNDELSQSGTRICIIPPNTEDATRLPAKLGQLSLIVPRSLRDGGNFTTLCLEKTEGLGWIPTVLDYCKL